MNTFNVSVQSQAPYQRDFVPKSPDAASFNKYGNIGVSYFTGSPNISFPLPLSEEVPMSINYNASGIKPEEHHGWMGTNWNLNVGGMITRIKRGLVDEFKQTTLTIPLDFEISYFDNYMRLDGDISTWDNSALTNKMDGAAYTSPDIEKRKIANADLQPDEFVFNFNGFSGSFLMNHLGKWVFRGNSPSEFEMMPIQIGNDINITLGTDVLVVQPRMITGFGIRTSDGTEYYFGNSSLTAVDFAYSYSVSGANQGSPPTGPDVISTGWHLTKIKYVSGKEINFTYIKDAFTITGNVTKNFGASSVQTPGLPPANTPINGVCYNVTTINNFTIIWNSYLKEIRTPYEIIKFTKTALTDNADYGIIFNTLGDLDLTQRKWFKLSKIQTYKNPVNSTDKPLIEYQFDYVNSASNRLQLSTIKQIDIESTTNPPASIKHYGFEYNDGTLPAYMSGKIDHWGYFNNKGMFDPDLSTSPDEATYKISRMPNNAVMGYEMLKKINYPTGGYTSFEFEPHDYAAVLDGLPLTVSGDVIYDHAFGLKLEMTNKTAGGLRVKRIVYSDGVNNLNNIEKSYSYINSTTPTVSSGILASEPHYYDIFSGYIGSYNTTNGYPNNIRVLNHSFMNEQSLNPLNLTSGSPVTYSEVVENNADGSYTIYKFSNFDDPKYRDRTPKVTRSKYNTTAINPKRDPIMDYEHLRGRVLSEKHYDNLNRVVKDISNEFNTTLESTEAIRVVTATFSRFCASGAFDPERRATSYYIHTSPVFLKKNTTTDYYYNGTTVSQMAVITENSYDGHKNIIEQKVTSSVPNSATDAETQSSITTKYSYAYDPTNLTAINSSVSETVTGTKQLMLDKFMIGIPLETKNTFNKGSKVEFKSFSVPVISIVNGTPTTIATNTSLLPYLFYEQNKTGSFTEQFRINSYQDYDKPTQTKAKGTNTPVVDYAWQDGLLKTKKYGTGTNLLTWTFYYDFAKRWLDSKKDENGLRAKFVYDGYRRLTTMQDRFNGTEASDFSIASPQNVQATTTYNYHYKGQSIPTGAPADDMNRNYVETNTSFANNTSSVPLSTKQYLDGLGRPFMTYKYKYFSNTSHQKSYIEYDNLGRPYKTYQPFANGTEGVDASIPSGSDVKETIFEKSPLSRVIQQKAEDDKYIEMRYGANTKTPNNTNPGSGLLKDDVRKFTVTAGRPSDVQLVNVSLNGLYDDNTLFKTTVWDENGTAKKPANTDLNDCYIGRSETFTDKLGRVILTRKFVKNASDVFIRVDTYNVYDDYGNLVLVIPPDGINANNAIQYPLCFQYIYDSENKLIEKKVPNADYVRYFYNNRDLLALTQDGNMRDAGKYLATVYDDLGRVVKTGFVTSNDPNNITISDAVNDPNRMTRTIYYDNSNWVKHQESKVLKHDDITTIRSHIWSYIERRPGYTYTGNPIWTGKQHLLSKTYRYGYDERGDEPIDDNDYGSVDWSVSGYDGLQKPTLSIRYLFSGYSWDQSQEVRQSQTFIYDNGQRLKQTNYMYALQGTGITATPTFELSSMTYNERDLLTNKKTAKDQGSGKYLQSTDFFYTQRNWLAAINPFFKNSDLDYPLFNATNNTQATANYYGALINGLHTPPAQQAATSPATEDNPDLFKEIIRYNDPFQYNSSGATIDKQYNGNIAQIESQVAGYEAQVYSFKYDNLDRMISADYADKHSVWGGSTPWTTQYETNSKFQENVTYDLRGNIQSINRKGTTDFPSPFNYYANNDPTKRLTYGYFGTIDDLTYHYNDPTNANKLTGVTDNSNLSRGFKTEFGNNNPASPDYTYDKNGNITSDANKGITSIEYNYLNLPTKITCYNPVGGGSRYIYFVYDASGQKHQKIVKDISCGFAGCTYPAPVTYTYVNGIEYTNGVLQRFAHTEGAVALQADGSTYAHEYVIKDHLGNTRVTYRDDNRTDINSPLGTIKVEEIVQVNHFYPFGLNMEGTWNGSFPEAKNKYQYNGKEWNSDFGLDLLDYGKRWYDPVIGRFPSVDPIIEKFAHATPYNYAENSPVANIDLWGLQKYHFTRLQNADGSSYLRLSGVSNFYETKAVSFHPFRSSGYYSYETKVNNDHQEYEVTQSIVKNDFTRLKNDFLGKTNDITKTYKTLEDAVNAPNSDFKKSKSEAFVENMLAYGAFGMTTEASEGKNLISLVQKGAEDVLSKGDYLRIQNAATRINKPITVVGSRANGTAGAYSDWDYVIEGITNKEWSKIKNSLPGSRSIIDNTPRNIDLFKTSFDINRPHITIHPR